VSWKIPRYFPQTFLLLSSLSVAFHATLQEHDFMFARSFKISLKYRMFFLKVITSTWGGGGTRWRSWLRHCATNRKITGSIPDGVTGFFQWLNPSSRIVAQGSTQPLTEMSIRRPVRRTDNLTTFLCRLSRNSGASASWNPKGLSRPVASKLYLLQVYRK
jgi:hypothetical protein